MDDTFDQMDTYDYDTSAESGHLGLTPGYGNHPFYNVQVDNSRNNFWPGIIPSGNKTVDFLAWSMARQGGGDGLFLLVGMLAGGILLGSYLYRNAYFPARYGIDEDALGASVYKKDLKFETYGLFTALAETVSNHSAMQEALKDPEVRKAITNLSGNHQLMKWSSEIHKLQSEYLQKDRLDDPIYVLESAKKLREKIVEKGQKFTAGTQYQYIIPTSEIGEDASSDAEVILVSEAAIDNALIKEAKDSKSIDKLLEAAKYRGFAKFSRADAVSVLVQEIAEKALLDGVDLDVSQRHLRDVLDTNELASDGFESKIDKALYLQMSSRSQLRNSENLESPEELTKAAFVSNLSVALQIPVEANASQEEIERNIQRKIEVMQDTDVARVCQEAIDLALRGDAQRIAKNLKSIYEFNETNPEAVKKALDVLKCEALPESVLKHLDFEAHGNFSLEAFTEEIYEALKQDIHVQPGGKSLVDEYTIIAKEKATQLKFKELNHEKAEEIQVSETNLVKLKDELNKTSNIQMSKETLRGLLQVSKKYHATEMLSEDAQLSRKDRDIALLKEDRAYMTNSGRLLTRLSTLSELETDLNLEPGALIKNPEIFEAFSKTYAAITEFGDESFVYELSRVTGKDEESIKEYLRSSEQEDKSRYVVGTGYMLKYIEDQHPEQLSSVLENATVLNEKALDPKSEDLVQQFLVKANEALKVNADINRDLLLAKATELGATRREYVGGISVLNSTESEQMKFLAEQAGVIGRNRGKTYLNNDLGKEQTQVIASVLSIQERARVHKELTKDPEFMNSTEKKLRDAFMSDPRSASEVVGKVWERYHELKQASSEHEEYARRTPKATKSYAKERKKFAEHADFVLKNEEFVINGSKFKMQEVIDGLITPQLQRAQEEIGNSEEKALGWIQALQRSELLSHSESRELVEKGLLSTETLGKLEPLRIEFVKQYIQETETGLNRMIADIDDLAERHPDRILDSNFLEQKQDLKRILEKFEKLSYGQYNMNSEVDRAEIDSLMKNLEIRGVSNQSKMRCTTSEIRELLVHSFTDLGNGTGTSKETVELMNTLYKHDVRSLSALFTPGVYHDELLERSRTNFVKLYDLDKGLLNGKIVPKASMDLKTFSAVLPEAAGLVHHSVAAANSQEMKFQSKLAANLFKHASFESKKGKAFGSEKDNQVTPDELRNAERRVIREKAKHRGV